MKNSIILSWLRGILQTILMMAMFVFSLGMGKANTVHASQASSTDDCGQLLADAEAQFRATLPKDGSVPASPEAQAAASEYIRVAKMCYDQMAATDTSAGLQSDTPAFIDDGGVLLGQSPSSSAEYVIKQGSKWGTTTQGTSGGTVTYSFMGNGISLADENAGTNAAITSLPTFKPCFITDIQTAFTAWQLVSNIKFVQVEDSGTPFNSQNATGDIRIGAHAFDGLNGTLAHAYYPPPNAVSAAGDIHFDTAENWTCAPSSGIDIGVVALHEIGHALGLQHEDTSTVALMDPYYNPNVTSIQADDANGAATIYGAAPLVAAPLNDNFSGATLITGLSYTSNIDTTSATTAGTDPNNFGPCDGKIMDQGSKSVWYKYTPAVNESISVDTSGTNYDTVIAVWTGTEGGLTLVKCNDDDIVGLTSALSYVATAGTTYYFEAMQYHCAINPPCGTPTTATGGNLKFHVNISNTDVYLGPTKQGSYYLYDTSTIIDNYSNEVNGPLKVINSTGNNIFASQRAIYGNSFNELMGYPSDQFTTEYWFPWYDQVYMQTWILVGNPSTTQIAYVNIYIGGVQRADTTGQIKTYAIPPGDRVTPQFPGILAGPVRVVSVTGNGTPTPINVFASERSLYGDSFNEVMGYPGNQFTTEYWFPWYDQIYMKTWVLVGNPSTTQTAYVNIYINGTRRTDADGKVQTYAIAPGGSVTPQFPGILDGAVRVVSVTGNGTPSPITVFASERSLFGTSFNEVMGYPADKFTSEYYFTWYNDREMASWILVGNPSTTQTAYVDIYIGGVKRNDTVGGIPYTIPPSGNITPKLGLNTGPVRVVSVTGPGTNSPIPIFTSERTTYLTSFNEMMGYPANQLSSEYWFTWYDNVYMKTDILFSKP